VVVVMGGVTSLLLELAERLVVYLLLPSACNHGRRA